MGFFDAQSIGGGRRNYMCERCGDTGEVRRGFCTAVCPQCNGNPRSQLPPKPDPPPAPPEAKRPTDTNVLTRIEALERRVAYLENKGLPEGVACVSSYDAGRKRNG